MEKVFINDSFNKALNDYTSSNEYPKGITYNSFLVVVIRLLIIIYNELDILNPLLMNDERLLKENLSKFGYTPDQVNEFFADLQRYYEIELKNEQNDIKIKNPFFISVQKKLIDMFIVKKLNFHLTQEETNEFYELLYTPYSKNPLRVSYNLLTAEDVLEIDRYFKKQMNDNVKVIIPEEKEYLNVKAYEILNYSMEDIRKMSGEEVNKVNSQVYDYFKIRENAINKEYLLEKALEELERENNKVTSGNGYVDILLVLSVICTVVMLIGIVMFILI